MNAPRLGTILLVAVLVAGVALVGPALAHGDETTAPTNETANETLWNDTAKTWTHHADAWNDRSLPDWMASHVSQTDDGWMASHTNQTDDGWMASHTNQGDHGWMGTATSVGTQDRPNTHTHQQAWNESDQPSHHQQDDDRPGTTMGGNHGHGW